VDSIKDMIEALGYTVTDTRSVTPKARVLQQGKTMLRKISAMKSVDELNSETSNQNWWMPQPNEDQRRVVMRYGGMTVPETSVFVDNTLAAVTKTLNDFVSVIERSTDAHWNAIQQQRDEEQAKRKKKAEPQS